MAEDDEDSDIGLISGIMKTSRSAMHWFIPSRLHVKKIFLGILAVSIVLIIFYYMKGSNDFMETKSYVHAKLKSPVFCGSSLSVQPSKQKSIMQMLKPVKTRSPGKVLLVPKTSYSRAHKSVNEILQAHRIGFKSSIAGKNLPDLIKVTKNLGKYRVIIFEDYRSYLEMDPWNRDILDKYCQTYKVGIIAFIPSDEQKPYEQVKFVDKSRKIGDTPIVSHRGKIEALEIFENSDFLHITKPNFATINDDHKAWVTLFTTNSNYQPLVMGHFRSKNDSIVQLPTVILDYGRQDGIPKVLFGSGIARHWTYRLLFLDALQYLSNGLINFPLVRYILVDIDDVFVGSNRFIRSDVQALISSQEKLAQLVPGFKYNLGFSGSTFQSGTEEENLADEMLMENRHKFWWFPHMWHHMQPHTFDNVSNLEKSMTKNFNFAKKYDIPVTNRYAIAPHHSGVYPVHEPLYQAWKDVWNISVTSTEEYPHLRPDHLRKGYVHNELRVLPRQTCGLFTKNLYYNQYPNGPEVLEKSIQGGELFQTIVNNPISVFMTHMPNYAFDRLAPYTFESVIKMLKCWTNLEIQTKEPLDLADQYFNMFPDEITPIWGNPCDDKRHMEIWSKSKSCDRLPDFLVIGPQKTGTTALYSFLQIHPAIRSNFESPTSFEELQFFSDASNYAKGIDWYMDLFPMRIPGQMTNKTYLFEKSATYFDRDVVPTRAYRLLKHAKLIAILISPAKRAYSWYQHMRAHEDEIAMHYSFHEVITATPNNASKALRSLQSRCLEPGKYASHLERWLQHYNTQQLYIVDGEELKSDPVNIMNKLQHFLNIQPIVDYRRLLKFDSKKGFYCPILHGKTKCLGKGKGRIYPPMETETQKYLQNYYRLYNEHLLKLLRRLGYATPEWLKRDLYDEVVDTN